MDPQSKPEIPSALVVGALLDTGADNTCISPMLARSLDIKAVGKLPVVDATGSAQMNLTMEFSGSSELWGEWRVGRGQGNPRDRGWGPP